MMQAIESSRFGTITVDEDLVLEFPRGVPGFEEALARLRLGMGD